MLHNEANIKGVDNEGRTVLHQAIIDGHEEMLEIFLANSASVEASGGEGTATQPVLEHSQTAILAELRARERSSTEMTGAKQPSGMHTPRGGRSPSVRQVRKTVLRKLGLRDETKP